MFSLLRALIWAPIWAIVALCFLYTVWFIFPHGMLINWTVFDQASTPGAIDKELRALIKEEFITLPTGVTLHVNIAGNKDAERHVYFLHGFPESGTLTWRHQIVYFAKKGYYVLAPDLRGFNTSSKPDGSLNYRPEVVAADVLELKKHYSGEKAILLVGHDFGGRVAWVFSALYPRHLERMAILNAIHPLIGWKMNFKQMFMSYYIYLFQTPYSLLQYKLEREDFNFLIQIGISYIKTPFISLYDIQQYKQKWRIPGELKSSINYYRALFYNVLEDLENPTFTIPTAVIFGSEDQYLDQNLLRESLNLVANINKQCISVNASHWVQQEKPAEVNEALEKWFDKKLI